MRRRVWTWSWPRPSRSTRCSCWRTGTARRRRRRGGAGRDTGLLQNLQERKAGLTQAPVAETHQPLHHRRRHSEAAGRREGQRGGKPSLAATGQVQEGPCRASQTFLSFGFWEGATAASEDSGLRWTGTSSCLHPALLPRQVPRIAALPTQATKSPRCRLRVLRGCQEQDCCRPPTRSRNELSVVSPEDSPWNNSPAL